jgi:hypothetical protein
MSDAQQATPEQHERMQAAIAEAQQRAAQEIQQNAQIEIQMRVQALSAAVNANTVGSEPETVAKAATVFLKFLKQGEASNG